MKLRTRLNLVVAGLTAALRGRADLSRRSRSTRASVREEIEAANRVASQLLGRLAAIYSREGGPEVVLRVPAAARPRAGERHHAAHAAGEVLYSLAAADVQGRPRGTRAGSRICWRPRPREHTFRCPAASQLVVEAETSRAILDAWDDLMRLL